METIYVPFTCNILTPGHIKLLKKLGKRGDVVVGLLTSKALKGYKKELMPFKDRLYILKELGLCTMIVPQNSLDPSENLKKYKCTSVASGDGWESVETEAIEKLGIKRINVRSGHKLHSSDILK